MLAIFELFWTKAMSLYTNWGCYQTLPLVPSVPFLSLLSNLMYRLSEIWKQDATRAAPFLPPPPHHHHGHYFDITKLPYQKQYPRHLLQKPPKVKVSLMSWFQDLWWSSTIFRMNMTESFCQLAGSLWWVHIIWWVFIIWCVSCPSNGKKLMMGVQHMMGIHHTIRVPFLFCNQNAKV